MLAFRATIYVLQYFVHSRLFGSGAFSWLTPYSIYAALRLKYPIYRLWNENSLYANTLLENCIKCYVCSSVMKCSNNNLSFIVYFYSWIDTVPNLRHHVSCLTSLETVWSISSSLKPLAQKASRARAEHRRKGLFTQETSPAAFWNTLFYWSLIEETNVSCCIELSTVKMHQLSFDRDSVWCTFMWPIEIIESHTGRGQRSAWIGASCFLYQRLLT